MKLLGCGGGAVEVLALPCLEGLLQVRPRKLDLQSVGSLQLLTPRHLALSPCEAASAAPNGACRWRCSQHMLEQGVCNEALEMRAAFAVRLEAPRSWQHVYTWRLHCWLHSACAYTRTHRESHQSQALSLPCSM